MNKLTENQEKNLHFVSDLNIFDSIDTIREKKEKLKKIKNQKSKYLNNINLFKYDSEKWKEKRRQLNKNINEIMFEKFNAENHKYLSKMRKGIDKSTENVRNIEKNLNVFFNEIDDFIDKQAEYIRENNPQSNYQSENISKRNSFNKRIKNIKEKK
jgi:hypothetical protein